MRIEITSGAHLDVADAMQYYLEQAGSDLAADFYFEFLAAVRKIGNHPQTYPIHFKEYRRMNLYRFPYNVLFRIVEASTVRILTVRHNSRHPSFGTERS